jgi:KUP system potassium uptake protein
MTESDTHAHGGVAALTVGALGVVYGDIGTSPLYAMRESFESHHHTLQTSTDNVFGVLSFVFWALVIIITVKYLLFVMRANNNGEGGILALTSLVLGAEGRTLSSKSRRGVLVLIGLFGTALLYGDGMITPAISVLSAVEGTKVKTPSLEHWVVPIAVVIIIGLFAVQKRGTASIGKVFGPVMILWFSVIALLGVREIIHTPEVLKALNPVYALQMLTSNSLDGFLALGSIFLVVTGGEALYADMGHFGVRPIKLGWFAMVLPALLCNYFGQGALLLKNPEAIDNPFYRLAPGWAVWPLVVLATMATVIASQALISGAYSLTMQAVQLGYIPRVKITHTSASAKGQIYIASINWALMIACIGLVLGFRKSTNLASAYGLAVTATMAITTVLFYVVLRERFGWRRPLALLLCSGFLVIDLGFLGANLFKIPDGGWFPLVIAGVVFTLMTTWRTGRQLVAANIRRNDLQLSSLMETIAERKYPRVPGTAVFFFSVPGLAPPALKANIRYNKVLHERTIVCCIRTEDIPRVAAEDRSEVIDLGWGVTQVVLHYGFMDEPNAYRGLTEGAAGQLGIDPERATYFLGSETLHVSDTPGMATWREHLFTFMLRNATKAANYFGLPSRRTVEVGLQVDI